MKLVQPSQIKSLPHTLVLGIGLLLGIGLMLASGSEVPAVVILIVFFIAFFLYGDLKGNATERHPLRPSRHGGYHLVLIVLEYGHFRWERRKQGYRP